jgi:hypothetical protein
MRTIGHSLLFTVAHGRRILFRGRTFARPRFYVPHLAGMSFVTRTTSKLDAHRAYSQLMPSSSSTSALARRARTMAGRPVPSQLGQVLARFGVREAAADHADGRIRAAPIGKGVFAFPGSRGRKRIGNRHEAAPLKLRGRRFRRPQFFAPECGRLATAKRPSATCGLFV